MIPIEELEKVLQGCISRKLKRVGRKEFIDLFDYLDKANGLNATQAARIAELEALVQRHEAALVAIAMGKVSLFGFYNENIYRASMTCWVGGEEIGDTPLAAIEAAMKERNNG